MLKENIDEIISRRVKLHIEDDFGLRKCWNEEIEILSRNISETISFIENECSDEIFCWIGEVFEDIAGVTQSKKFLKTIKNRAEKIIDEKSRQSVEKDIRCAENKFTRIKSVK